jgi:hypothetical protein
MKQLLLFLINPCIPLCIYIVGCNTQAQVKNDYPTSSAKQSKKDIAKKDANPQNYDSIKKVIQTEKQKLITFYRNADTDNYTYASKQFLYLWEQKLIPYWFGTAWDFNGTTKTSGKGVIACGYFVTTTLYDIGVPINVPKYAQCGSEVMMKHLVSKKHFALYNNLSFTAFINKLKSKGPFLAIVGLDFHTGYLLHTGKELYFIHSSYINNRGVIQQVAAESGELKSSKWRSVAFLTEDDVFLKKWLDFTH